MNELALFAGAGGGCLASKHLLGHRIVCYVERERYCVDVLKARIADGCLDDAPIWDDVRTFDGVPWRGVVDLVSAGFPCQPFSLAGKQLASVDPRNCWPDTLRIIRQVNPWFVFLENVPGLLSGSHGYFATVLGQLAEIGFDAEWSCLSARAFNAPHIRERIWVVASNTKGKRLEKRKGQFCNYGKERKASLRSDWWQSEPGLVRMADGVPDRVERITALGNGQVPRVAAEAFKRLNESQ